MRSRADGICADRLGDILEPLLAPVLEANVQLAFDFAIHLLGNQDAARIGDPLQPDRNVDPVAVEFTVLPNDNVTKVDPDAQTEGTAARAEMVRISTAHRTAAKGLANSTSAPSPV